MVLREAWEQLYTFQASACTEFSPTQSTLRSCLCYIKYGERYETYPASSWKQQLACEQVGLIGISHIRMYVRGREVVFL